MGKSPGKWIKAKLFGKKSAKSAISERGKAGKEAFIVTKVVAANDPVISDPQPVVVDRNGHNLTSVNQTVTKLPEEGSILLSGSQDGVVKSTGLTSDNRSDILNQEQAAAKVQAALRGFLARRAFWALKGIIRLQALIRGHLVRRQAVATLRSIQGIVKLQALFRGRKVRISEAAGIEVHEKCNLELDIIGTLQANHTLKLSRNSFAQKLLAALPNATPLALHYSPAGSNSAWNWSERWSASRFWEFVRDPKSDVGSKASKKSGGNKGVELETGRPKRGIRRNSTNHDNSSDNGKPRGTMKRSISHQAEAAQETAQNELEKVKQNLRKVSLTKTETRVKTETVIEKPKRKISDVQDTANPDAPEQGLINSIEKKGDPTDSSPIEKHKEPVDTIVTEKDNDSYDAIAKEPDTVNPQQHMVEILEHARPDEPSSEALQQSIDNNENPPIVEELHSKEDPSGKENLKARRRKSLSAKHDYPENVAQNTPTLPSYMQATQSAKAKLRAQGSPRLSQETPENGIVRRHSLPSSTGGKMNTPSPRIQKLVQGSGKGSGIKSDKSLSASKDFNSNERAAEWRR